jgi:imidazolonepropionase-like amidohydrolase
MGTAIDPSSILRATSEHPIWLRVGTLVDGTSPSPAFGAQVVYDAQRIRFVGTTDRSPPPEVVREGQRRPDLDLPDHVLLPGLVDAHAHLFLEGGELDANGRAAYLEKHPEALLDAACERLEKLVRLGIAGVRDAGDKHGVGLALSRMYASPDRPVMPYMESPGPAIHHQGRYGGFMADPLEHYASPRACVEARIAAGADRIKLIPTGIINFKQGCVTSEPQMTTAEIAEIVATAKTHGRQTFAHASGDKGIDRAVAGGVDSIEHGFFIRDDQLAQLRDRSIAWVPTFAPVYAQIVHALRLGWDTSIIGHLTRILDRHAASLIKAHHLGVTIVGGSDAGSYGVAHGFGLLDELELMERAGLPAMAVLNAATGAGALRFNYKDDFGRIAAGYRSRFILTKHSPLQRISNLREPRIVVFDGNVYENEASIDRAGL